MLKISKVTDKKPWVINSSIGGVMLAQYPKVRLGVYLVALGVFSLAAILQADSVANGLTTAGAILSAAATGTAISHMNPPTGKPPGR
jgi:hypothetical protein